MPRKSKKDEPLREAKVVETPDENESDVYIPDDSMLLPNEGQAFHEEESEEIKEERSEDQAMFQGNEALVQAVFDWMDNEIKQTDSVQTARSVAKEYEITIEQAIAVCDIVAKVIEFTRVHFQTIPDRIKTKETDS